LSFNFLGLNENAYLIENNVIKMTSPKPKEKLTEMEVNVVVNIAELYERLNISPREHEKVKKILKTPL
jgi:hypothetical protein